MEIIELSFERFQDARRYLMTNGRELEQALFRFHFENGSKQEVLLKLSEFQADNGGFSGMGEGDSKYANAMDTNMAFQCLSDVGASPQDEIVQRGIQYIIKSYDPANRCWHPNPYNKKGGWLDNPSAELLGYLYEYRELVPADFLRLVTEHANASITMTKTSMKLDQFYFLTALCLARLALRTGEPLKSRILSRLFHEMPLFIETDAEKWTTTYCAKPFFFAETPTSPFYLPIQADVIKSLENEMATQAADGHFILNWGGTNEAARIWRSINTLHILKVLKNHNMIGKQTEGVHFE